MQIYKEIAKLQNKIYYGFSTHRDKCTHNFLNNITGNISRLMFTGSTILDINGNQWFPLFDAMTDKKAQLSLTNPRDAKACQKLLQFDVLTTLSLTILAYLHSFSCCCVRNLRNPTKFTENAKLWSSRPSKVIDLGVNRKPMYNFLLVTNSNFRRICYRFRDIDA